MLVGILSDSHGQYLAVRQAVKLFDEQGVEHIVHCGDVCGSEVFDELVGRPCSFVWGNMDCPEGDLLAYLETVGIAVPQRAPLRLSLGGKTFAIFHGHEPGFQGAIRTLKVDYILHGHTHLASDGTLEHARVINPGALYRANPTTVATLETTTDQLTFHEIHVS